MPTTHTIIQGDTLTRIAAEYKFQSWKDLYNHPENAEFRTKRGNPDLIFPGDTIIIPDPEPQKISVQAGSSHAFSLTKETETLRINVSADEGLETEGKKAVLKVGNDKLETILGRDGALELELSDSAAEKGQLELYLDDNSDEPSHTYELAIGHLDPAEELSGVQARCNALGFDCGVIDGIMGNKTREGVEMFQYVHELEVDGDPGPITQGKLKEIYGC